MKNWNNGLMLFEKRKIVFIITLAAISFSSVTAQMLKGRITDRSGEPVQYATVFFQELKHGTTSNPRGDYEIRLPEGRHTVIYQSLGFEPFMSEITIKGDTVVKDVVLTEQYYQIPEVLITEKGEDPAYYIMRRVIGLAPYHLNHVNQYKAEVYLKGTLNVKKIPRIIQRSLKMETGKRPPHSSEVSVTIKEGDSFFLESFNEIDFKAPDKYIQRVVSFNSNFPDQGEEISPMDYIKASFYQPVIAQMAISPLSPSAFSYYRFRYMGASLQGENSVSKIEVTPRHKSPQLFEGTIYIVDDLWCLHSVDLSNENMAGKIHIKEVHIPVQDGIWMPVSHYFEMNFSIMGFKADVYYRSSVKYLSVEANSSLKKPDPVTGTYTTAKNYVPDTLMTKNRKRIEEILKKDEMSNRDMIKLADLMNRESAESLKDTILKNLEIKEKTQYIIEKDAGKKDSSFWAGIRPIPLSEAEIKALGTKTNSGRLREAIGDSSVPAIENKKSSLVNDLKHIAFGNNWSDSKGWRFSGGGLINPRCFSFNTVDGFIIGTDLRITREFSKKWSFSLYPEIRYAFSREKLMGRANININSGGMKPLRIFLQSGITSRDISTSGGINPLLNSATSLLLKKNYLKLYDSHYLNLGFSFEVKNGVNIELSTGIDHRRVLKNNTDFTIFRSSREYTDNVPDNSYLDEEGTYPRLLYNQNQVSFSANLTVVPYQRYRINNGNKIPEGSRWPTFRFYWKHLMNTDSNAGDSYAHFDMLRFEVSQKLDPGAFRELKWMIRTGGYTDNRGISFFDFFHFNNQTFPLLIYNQDDAFMVPRYYTLSTPEFFTEAHLKYTSPYLLFKYLPGLNRTLVRENLVFSFLGSRYKNCYTEIGYSLSEILLLAEVGVYVGFDDLIYKFTGIKISLRFN